LLDRKSTRIEIVALRSLLDPPHQGDDRIGIATDTVIACGRKDHTRDRKSRREAEQEQHAGAGFRHSALHACSG
jgi:hypothetical protein